MNNFTSGTSHYYDDFDLSEYLMKNNLGTLNDMSQTITTGVFHKINKIVPVCTQTIEENFMILKNRLYSHNPINQDQLFVKIYNKTLEETAKDIINYYIQEKSNSDISLWNYTLREGNKDNIREFSDLKTNHNYIYFDQTGRY